jgi:hypothetical protein
MLVLGEWIGASGDCVKGTKRSLTGLKEIW